MKIFFGKSSLKYLQKLDKETAGKIIKACGKLPEVGHIKKLKGERIKNVFRLRVGKYRVIFIRENDSIKIMKIDSRGDVYKRY